MQSCWNRNALCAHHESVVNSIEAQVSDILVKNSSPSAWVCWISRMLMKSSKRGIQHAYEK